MTETTFTVAQLKFRAKDIRTKNPNLTHSAALEALAHQMGFRDWNTLNAAARPSPTWSVGDRISGMYLGQRFQGSVLALTSTGANHQMTVQFDDPIDVVTSSAFSNMRRRVTVILTAKGQTLEKTSDGQPHMILD